MALRAPVSMLSVASTTSASLHDSSDRVGFCRFPTYTISFLRSEVGALKFKGVKLAYRSGTRCYSYGGTHMNLFDRFVRVIKPYINELFSLFEDPEKIFDKAITEMNDDLSKMHQATAQVLASQKQLQNKYKSVEGASLKLYKRSQLAISKGDENLAREALKISKAFADNADALKAQIDHQKHVVENLTNNTRLLETKIQEAKSKKDIWKAREQSVKTTENVSKMLWKVNTSRPLSKLEKMEQKAMTMESRAEALDQKTMYELEGKFAMLGSAFLDDDDLANLMKERSRSTRFIKSKIQKTKLKIGTRKAHAQSAKSVIKASEMFWNEDTKMEEKGLNPSHGAVVRKNARIASRKKPNSNNNERISKREDGGELKEVDSMIICSPEPQVKVLVDIT